ncbi:FAD-linked oxidase C-terminal domain-containing protein [Amphritea sp. 2_MG-2023]|uniref:FAD-linked oxidase C-terminal domain-containing protein n=1 Tax=Amphritea TaxID=515417 RepID=UPI001C0748A6|nr:MULTISPECIES: FAD-linked oxidase C-terminal domain-containing protein [Amphritea]MBU2966083.1 FAD-binding protein [Amphritea atlantica]MDO6418173.1 FAD-linked oxidase C-terminal domain-containing protein [Amphritea sp. 2_MG-2023]
MCDAQPIREQQLQRILTPLQRFMKAENIVTSVEALRAYECDAFTTMRQLPLLTLLPENIEQVQQIMRLCYQLDIPVVARGAGTGLTAGSMPVENGVLLSMTKFDQILEIDIANRTALIEPGVRNLAVTEAVAPYDLYFAPDPSSQLACSVGGNVAENAGGIHCLKYGLTVHNILALDVITIEGERLTLGGASLDAPGYDLTALLTGSEGLLGVIVGIRVKLLAKPASARVLLCGFASIENASHAIAQIISAGIIPAGLEMIDHTGINAIEELMHAGYPTDAAAVLICELDGSVDEVEDELARVILLLEALDATNIEISNSEAEKARIWAARKAAFPAMARLAPDNYIMDGTIPRRALAAVWQRINQLADEYQLLVVNVFHAGDGNMHPSILFDAMDADQRHRAEELGTRILELCIEVGGTISGEHGVGLEKINQMCLQFNHDELQQFHGVKAAFDAKNLLNPGKQIPTLARCAEFNGMHVHKGEIAFPDLERF